MSGLGEFDLIRRHFSRPVPTGILGPGDDCALLPQPSGVLAVSTDLLLEGRHFFPDVDPQRLGHKALAVNLSDLAAMGARPLGCVLGLALPRADDAWLGAFARGWYELAEQWQCPLIGGDTTRAERELTISVTVLGDISTAGALRRDAAQPGDDIWISGSPGVADVALQLALRLRTQRTREDPLGRWVASLSYSQARDWWLRTRDALELPQPRVGLGLELASLAHAALDVSDGLLQDLGHIVQASACGAEILASALPVEALEGLPKDAAWQAVLGGGDAYELCFTAAPEHAAAIEAAARRAGVPVYRIGRMVAGLSDVVVLDEDGKVWLPPVRGYDHFSPSSASQQE